MLTKNGRRGNTLDTDILPGKVHNGTAGKSLPRFINKPFWIFFLIGTKNKPYESRDFHFSTSVGLLCQGLLETRHGLSSFKVQKQISHMEYILRIMIIIKKEKEVHDQLGNIQFLKWILVPWGISLIHSCVWRTGRVHPWNIKNNDYN